MTTLRIHYHVLKEILRLPPSAVIVTIRQAEDSSQCIVELAGDLPQGEVTAHYTYEHATIIKFDGFHPVIP